MASQNFLGASITGGTREKTYFEQQREALIGEIANSFEHVLANINKLNRSLEAVITVRFCPLLSVSLPHKPSRVSRSIFGGLKTKANNFWR